MIDSSELIRVERGAVDPQVYARRLPALGYIAAITVSELMAGALLADSPERRQWRRRFLEDLVRVLEVLPFGEVEARKHAEIQVLLRLAGEQIGSADLMIAATALVHGHDVLT